MMTLTVSSYPRHGWRNPAAQSQRLPAGQCRRDHRGAPGKGPAGLSRWRRLDARNGVESGAILP